MKWEQAWLDYGRINRKREDYAIWWNPQIIWEGYSREDYGLRDSAVWELNKALEWGDSPSSSVIYLKIADYEEPECYRLTTDEHELTISGSAVGILYGVFAFLRHLQMGENVNLLTEYSAPEFGLRMLNHWDNIDGSIERGYAGNSFFFVNENLIIDGRTEDYARLMASVGLNGAVINNVNVRGKACNLILPEFYDRLNELGDLFYSYGIRLFLSVDFAAPIDLGGLDSADPMDEQVRSWWQLTAEHLYAHVRHFGGFLVKADSEGRPGPFTYHRTHADGANMLADVLKPYGGIVIWRCFVYNCTQDWRDYKTDRAKAAYDNFKPLDGTFADNVILQIKNGPMDFQVREPVSPLFGAMPQTNQMLELQITQEYTGQQKDLCYLLPWFSQILDFDTFCRPKESGEADDITRVRSIIGGKTFRNDKYKCGICAVANTGDDANWTGHDLAQANWYGFGRLAWNSRLGAEHIAEEWIKLTFSIEKETAAETIKRLLMRSWPVYEAYTAPLGIGWMCNPGHHYGVNVDGYEYDRWGTYHRADCRGIGVDRSREGTGYTNQYFRENAGLYDDPKTCPDELLLFFHHMPYSHVLKSGKTILQHIYDTHFEGAAEAECFLTMWDSISQDINPGVYARVRERLCLQAENAKEWRDRINTYFYRKTLIPDEKGRRIY